MSCKCKSWRLYAVMGSVSIVILILVVTLCTILSQNIKKNSGRSESNQNENSTLTRWQNLNDVCTPEWYKNSNANRKRCAIPLICEYKSFGDTEGRCRYPQSKGESESCFTSPFLCKEELKCEKSLAVCKRQINIGDVCTPQTEFLCKSEHCTFLNPNIPTQFCVATDLTLNSTCNEYNQCSKNSMRCVNNKCVLNTTPFTNTQPMARYYGGGTPNTANPPPYYYNPNQAQSLQSPPINNSPYTMNNYMNAPPQMHPYNPNNTAMMNTNNNRRVLQKKAIPQEEEGTLLQSLLMYTAYLSDEVFLMPITPIEVNQVIIKVMNDVDIQSLNEKEMLLYTEIQNLNQDELYAYAALYPVLLSLNDPLHPSPEDKNKNDAFLGRDDQVVFMDSNNPIPGNTINTLIKRESPNTMKYSDILEDSSMYTSLHDIQNGNPMFDTPEHHDHIHLDNHNTMNINSVEGITNHSTTTTTTPTTSVFSLHGTPHTPEDELIEGLNYTQYYPNANLPKYVYRRKTSNINMQQYPNTAPQYGSNTVMHPNTMNDGQLHTPYPSYPQRPPQHSSVLQPVGTDTMPLYPPRRSPMPRPCINDRSCGKDAYCGFHNYRMGCIQRKEPNTKCIGHSIRECIDLHSCINGICQRWFTKKANVLWFTGNTHFSNICAPWQKSRLYENNDMTNTEFFPEDEMHSLKRILYTSYNKDTNTLLKDIQSYSKQYKMDCISLNKKPCATDEECWGVTPFGYCDTNRTCVSPEYTQCLDLFTKYYHCIHLKYIIDYRKEKNIFDFSSIQYAPMDLIYNVSYHVSILYATQMQEECTPRDIIQKRNALLKCIQGSVKELKHIVYIK